MDYKENIYKIGKSSNDNESSFFGEWVFYEGPEEYEDAINYLRLWKKFILKRLSELEQIGLDQIVLRNDISGNGKHTLGIKIEMKNKG